MSRRALSGSRPSLELVLRPGPGLRCPSLPTAARSHPTPRAPSPLSRFGTRLALRTQAATPDPRPALTLRAAALCGSDRCGRPEDARGSHACSAARPSVSQQACGVRGPGSTPHSPPPTPARSSRALPPRPRPPAVLPARRRRSARLLFPLPPPAFILSLPFRDPGPCCPAQVGLRCTSPSTPLDAQAGPMDRSCQGHPLALDKRTPNSKGFALPEVCKGKVLLQGRSPPAHQVHGALLGRFAKFTTNL